MAMKIISIWLSQENEKPVIDRLNSVNSVNKYIKGLVSDDIGIKNKYWDDLEFTTDTASHRITGSFSLSFNTKTETALLEKMNSVDNRRAYICGLVRDDIAADSGVSWHQLTEKYDLTDYRDTAVIAADRLEELAAILQKAGCNDKAAVCADLVTRLISLAECIK